MIASAIALRLLAKLKYREVTLIFIKSFLFLLSISFFALFFVSFCWARPAEKYNTGNKDPTQNEEQALS